MRRIRKKTHSLCNFQRIFIFSSGDYGMKVTPVPIPNTTVKLQCANGTAGVTLWESRLSPGLKKRYILYNVFFYCFLISCTTKRGAVPLYKYLVVYNVIEPLLIFLCIVQGLTPNSFEALTTEPYFSRAFGIII
jgi:hypothetical protein